jgi:hypothetical protein
MTLLWYYCLAGKGTMDITHEWCPKITSGEATSDFGTTKIVFTSGATEKITSGVPTSENNF